MTDKLASKAVLRKMYSHLCLIPTKPSAMPQTTKITPAMPIAGVISGCIGRLSECAGVVDGDVAAASVDIDDETTDVAELAVKVVEATLEMNEDELPDVLEGRDAVPEELPERPCIMNDDGSLMAVCVLDTMPVLDAGADNAPLDVAPSVTSRCRSKACLPAARSAQLSANSSVINP